MSLMREYGRQARAPDLLHRRKNRRLVVDHHVLRRRKLTFHVLQHSLLVHIDQHTAAHGAPEAAALDLERLKDRIAV